MKKLIYGFLIIFCLIGAIVLKITPVFADDTTDETQLFSGEDTVVSQDTVVKDNVGDELKQKHIGFSGEIDTATTYTNFDPAYDWTGLGGQELSNQISADLLLDIRLKQGIKGFLSAGVNYYPAGKDQELSLSDEEKKRLGLNPDDVVTTKQYTEFKINEFFVDTNWQNKVYFRTGKQVLQWGTGYLWNPTDLINKDRKDFSDMSKVQEGTFGEKIQIPMGAKQNVYFYVKMNDSTTLDGASLASKYEFLLGSTEMSFSVLTGGGYKSAITNEFIGYKPVYGFDFSGAKLGNLNVYGEVSLNPGDRQMMDYDNLISRDEADNWTPKASLGFKKFFDKGAIKDGISVTSEFYYNGAGYDKNIFQRIVDFDASKKLTYYSSYYQSYMNSKYYMALFSSVQKFMNPDATLNINAIANLIDHSSTLITEISYSPALTDFTFDFKITGYFGDPNTEATFSGNRYSIYLGTKILF